jgi:hypothetical protein
MQKKTFFKSSSEWYWAFEGIKPIEYRDWGQLGEGE